MARIEKVAVFSSASSPAAGSLRSGGPGRLPHSHTYAVICAETTHMWRRISRAHLGEFPFLVKPESHSMPARKKNPSLSVYWDLLLTSARHGRQAVFSPDVPEWLGSARVLC